MLRGITLTLLLTLPAAAQVKTALRPARVNQPVKSPTTAKPQPLNTDAVANVLLRAHGQGEFDGVVVLSQNGRTVYTTAIGLADRAAKIPLRPTTLFRLASLTKQVTALLIMQQVAAGHLTLDTPAGTAMPTLPETTARITIRQLLQHTSGLANPTSGPEDKVPAFYTRTTPDAGDNTHTALTTCSATPKQEPGKSLDYNNCDYIVLGAILETLTHQPYATLVKSAVLNPLGIRSWGIFPADPAEAPVTARAYKEDGTLDDPQNPATYGAAGALYGNALDVAVWDEALLTHPLLSAPLTDVMFQADPKLYGEALGSWSYEFKPYDFKGGPTEPATRIIERQGDIGSTRLLNLLLPQRNASIVIIANTDRADLFNTYAKKGIAYEILRAALLKAALTEK